MVANQAAPAEPHAARYVDARRQAILADIVFRRTEPYGYVPLDTELGAYIMRADAPVGIGAQHIRVVDNCAKLHNVIINGAIEMLVGQPLSDARKEEITRVAQNEMARYIHEKEDAVQFLREQAAVAAEMGQTAFSEESLARAVEIHLDARGAI